VSQSLSQIWVHLIFSTKKRKPFLKNPELRKRLHHFATVCNQQHCQPLIIGGVEDHVHLLINLHKSQSLSAIIEKIKKYSSRWIKTLASEDEYLKQFYWQNGYGAFSVSQSNIEKVKHYIENQKIHHKKVSFQEELRKILSICGVAYDEKYIWD
jgi:REP element-mobilizing transposase RayT